jgi:hypothetical protein
VDGCEEFWKHILKVRRAALGPLTEAPRQQFGDFIHRDTASKFSTFGSAHAIAHCEDKVGFPKGGGPDFAKKTNLGGVE